MFPKEKTVRDEKYKHWISTLPCLQCNTPGPSNPHHVFTGGVGVKCDDRFLVSLCTPCHNYWHDHLGKSGGHSREYLYEIAGRLRKIYEERMQS